MREILFRGKRLNNGEWCYGSYLFLHISPVDWTGAKRGKPEDVHYIVNDQDINYAVYPSTIGQYTGLTDKNGKWIFEGDIVAQNWYDYDEPRDDSFGNVEFCEYDCSFSVMDVNKDGFMPLGRCGSYHLEVEVIGNVHDNHELLEK